MKSELDSMGPQLIALLAACSERSSFAAVAKALSTHQSTIARQMDRLEDLLGYRLLNRTAEGFSLTPNGAALVPLALAHQKAVTDFKRKAAALADENAHAITVQAPEGLGTYWITPHYVRNVVAEDTRLHLVCSDTLPDLREGAVHISVQYSPADDEDCVQVTLGYLHVIPFASQSYVDEFGAPKCARDLAGHRLVSQTGPHDVVDLWFTLAAEDGDEAITDAISMYTNSGSAHYAAVRAGFGIGAIPSYAASVDLDLVPIDIGASQRIPIYAVFERKSRDLSRFDEILRWIQSIFAEDAYPFFGASPKSFAVDAPKRSFPAA